MSVLKRVLVLHGYSQNAIVFSKRLGALRKEKESKGVEYVFVNAPHILQPAELFGAPTDGLTDGQGPSLADIQANPETALRAWWRANKERTQATGLQESILYIRDVLKEQRFDGVFGFSQGAAFAALISALLERPHLYPPFLVDGNPPHPPLQFCVAVSGFKVRDPFCEPFFTPSYATPTLHVIGKTDVVVTEERSRQLLEVSSNARLEEHEGGHFVPSKANWRKFLASYMKDQSAVLSTPGGLLTQSEPSSGAVTPVGGPDYKSVVQMKL